MDLIVVLERTGLTPLRLRYAMRAAVPLARQAYWANPDANSAYKNASSADLADLRAGKYVELVREQEFGAMTQAQIRATLVDAQTTFQAKVEADAGMNPWKFYGTRWDGATWTAGGVN